MLDPSRRWNQGCYSRLGSSSDMREVGGPKHHARKPEERRVALIDQ